jgi:hypothetical protein
VSDREDDTAELYRLLLGRLQQASDDAVDVEALRLMWLVQPAPAVSVEPRPLLPVLAAMDVLTLEDFVALVTSTSFRAALMVFAVLLAPGSRELLLSMLGVVEADG